MYPANKMFKTKHNNIATHSSFQREVSFDSFRSMASDTLIFGSTKAIVKIKHGIFFRQCGTKVWCNTGYYIANQNI